MEGLSGVKGLRLAEAVAELVHDGDSVALEGFTHLIPTAAAHEIIRQRRRDLTLIRMTPDLIYDQLIGMGCARKLVFSWGGNPGVGSLHRFRDAVEHGHPHPLEIEEHSHAGMANRYVAGAARLPFAVLRGYVGTDLPSVTPTISTVRCPFTGEELAAVPALNPDVAIVHAQQADRRGNVAFWGITGVQKEVVLAASRSLVTVEEIVDEIQPHHGQVVLPSIAVDAVVQVERGSYPSYAHGYYDRDNAFYREWDVISRDRDAFAAWMRDHVLDVEDHAAHLRSLG
ncbi:CoA transferase subunit A [Allokutzneria oryzae]|uniref:CoA transferase subunit A n=1 Tax=Allokutzneria oryzae TaxID=1378989 RepID=A0ABV5ZUA6_9PSEU